MSDQTSPQIKQGQSNDHNKEEIATILASLNSSTEEGTVPIESKNISTEPLFDEAGGRKTLEVQTAQIQESVAKEALELTYIDQSHAVSLPPPPETSEEYKQKGADHRSFDIAQKAFGLFLAVLPYLVVFGIGVAGYYFFLADRSARWDIAFWKKEEDPLQKDVGARKKILDDAKSANASEYKKWIKQFFFSVTDGDVVAMDTPSANGLTNFENYLLKLNPKTRDADNNGKQDALDILENRNPETGLGLTDSQRDTLAKYINAEEIRTRLAVPGSMNTKQIPGKGVFIRGHKTAQAASSQVAGASELANSKSETNSIVRTSDAAINYQNKHDINLKIPGKLEIASIGVNVPIVWTVDAKNFDEDLKRGIVHHPSTPLPGDIGTAYLSGHSSNYLWVKADFNKVFEKLNDLPVGATFKLTVVNKAGKTIRLHYTVDNNKIFKADDQTQFMNFADSRVALSTCWPIGSLDKRLVTFGNLTRVEE